LKSNEFRFSNPLGNVKYLKGKYIVFIGNKKVTTLKPQHFKIDENCPSKIEMEIDGNNVFVDKTTEIFVNKNFKIIKNNDIRVNVIGFKREGVSNEVGIKIQHKSLSKKFSIDKNNRKYRIEFYKDNKFCYMSVVNFK